MSEPFIAEVRIFAGNFAPRGYAFCQGQLLPIAQNTALFSLIGNYYGGDGRTTMGLPDLRGRTPLGQGQGPGLTTRRIGDKSGATTVTLSEAELPAHAHTLQAVAAVGSTPTPGNNTLLAQAPSGGRGGGGAQVYGASQNLVAMAPASITATGGSQSHDNMQPYLAVNFIIALEGLYPSRN